MKTRSGDVAVITGGARGIGAAVVKKLLQCEMHVVIGKQLDDFHIYWIIYVHPQGSKFIILNDL